MMKAMKMSGMALLAALTMAGEVRFARAADTVAYFQIKGAGVPIGQMTVQLNDTAKPDSVRNFLSYVQSGSYSNTFLHRCVSNFVLQGGGYFVSDPASLSPMIGYATVTRFAAISNEFSVGPVLPNEYGTLALAKRPGDPHSATSEWFFNLADNSAEFGPANNGGYVVIGRVIEQTNYLTGNTNLLDLFANRSPGQGTVNLTVFYGTNASIFTDLPVNYVGATAPRYADLFTVEITAPNAPDGVLPTIEVAVPSGDARSILPEFTARGSAADNVGVSSVQLRLNGGAWVPALGSNSWTADVILTPGTNVMEFRSVDVRGNSSAVTRRTVVLGTDTVAGDYTGLFYETNVVAYESSGSFKLTVNANRSYTATLEIEGRNVKVKGQLNGQYRATNTFSRAESDGGDLTIIWQLHPTDPTGLVFGSVSSDTWRSPLLGYRYVYSKGEPPFRGERGDYTLSFGPTPDSSVAPGGSGYGIVRVDKSGNVNLKAYLADDSTASQKVVAGGPNGNWPLYASLYGNKGMLIGWINFTNLLNADLNGTVTWVKQEKDGGNKYYPGGFTNTISAQGAYYTYPGLARAVNWSNGIVVLSGAGLTATWTNEISINQNNGVKDESTNSFSMNLDSSSGHFSGNFKEPGTGTEVNFSGILNQKTQTGDGFHLNSDNKQSGSVFVGPR
jgi:cyclophilin family peptidyl-prolyl cis-trans isomerase